MKWQGMHNCSYRQIEDMIGQELQEEQKYVGLTKVHDMIDGSLDLHLNDCYVQEEPLCFVGAVLHSWQSNNPAHIGCLYTKE